MAKPSLALMLMSKKPPMGGDDDDEDAPPSSRPGGDHGDMSKSAMRDFMDALKTDDEAAALDAFKDLCGLCAGPDDDDEDQ